MGKYYDGTKLLSMLDLHNEKPEIYISTSNRSAGKTTFFTKMIVNRFIRKHEKFIILYRYKYETRNCSDKIFSGVKDLFFKDYTMTEKTMCNGCYRELFLAKNDETPLSCGYAISINCADILKKYSHLLSDATSILFDEFQTENDCYCDNEIQKFISLHNSLARGSGKQSKYLPVYMLSNTVNLCNPYYMELGVTERLYKDTKYLRGCGWVVEQCYNTSASEALKQSTFNRAFSMNKYLNYSMNGSYLLEDKSFIEKPSGNSRYFCTLLLRDQKVSIYQYETFYYCSNICPKNGSINIACDLASFNIHNQSKLRYNISIFKDVFVSGNMRFQNQSVKNIFLQCVKITV